VTARAGGTAKKAVFASSADRGQSSRYAAYTYLAYVFRSSLSAGKRSPNPVRLSSAGSTEVTRLYKIRGWNPLTQQFESWTSSDPLSPAPSGAVLTEVSSFLLSDR
jgi:hypothetical protein